MPKYSMRQIKDAYIQKKDWEKQFPTIYYFSRPISFYLTYLIIRITDIPSRVVWFGFFVGLMGCLAFLFIPHCTVWLGISLIMSFAILDAVDGNIARVSGKVTYYGKFLDGVIGEIIEASYPFWLGLGLYLVPLKLGALSLWDLGDKSNLFMLLAGTAIMCARLYSTLFLVNYYDMLTLKKTVTPQGNITDPFKSSRYRKYWWYLLFINLHTLTLQVLLLALCASLKMIDIFLFFFAGYYLFRMFITFTFYTYRAQRNLS
ncbi:MAG: CDP-alcohol phosphatidyltransferase family protein [Candidatus Omnitrophota bacterium]|nr:MAG: CDP-alcohol phosphatidyltransferase family protein [Candidatus Omnitrophota bacterium]